MRPMTSPEAIQREVEKVRSEDQWASFIIPAVIMVLTIIPQFFTWAPDDIYMATLSRPDQYAERTFIYASRPLGAALFWLASLLHISIIRDVYLFSALYAVSFAWFFSTAIFWVCDWKPPPLTVAAGAALVCLYGFQIDFNQFTHQYIVVSLMYLLMAAYLRVSRLARPRSARLLLLVAIGFLANLCYQAATMGLALLLAGRLLIMATKDRPAARNAPQDLLSIFDGFAGILLSCICYFVLTKITYRLDIATWRPPVQITWAWLIHRSFEYYQAVLALLTPVGRPYYAQNDLGCILWSIIAILLLIRIYTTKGLKSLALPAALILFIIILAQNPQNLFLPIYWPAPRASFYASFVSPVLLVAAFSAFDGNTAMACTGRKFLQWITLFSVILELSATSYVIIDHMHTYSQDMALAREISRKISENPRLAKLTHIQFPPASWHPRNGYFLGREPPSYDYGSLFAAPWSANALIEMASGLKFTVSGTSTCPTGPRTIWTLTVRRDGNSIAVCF